jgi:hypothetical protein
MLNNLQAEFREMLDLTAHIANFDATLAAARSAGRPIEPTQDAYDVRKQRERRLIELRGKWTI